MIDGRLFLSYSSNLGMDAVVDACKCAGMQGERCVEFSSIGRCCCLPRSRSNFPRAKGLGDTVSTRSRSRDLKCSTSGLLSIPSWKNPHLIYVLVHIENKCQYQDMYDLKNDWCKGLSHELFLRVSAR